MLATDSEPTVLEAYDARQLQQDAVVARVEERIGAPFADWTPEDYSKFMDGLDLLLEADLWEWSHVTGVPIVALRKGYDFFRSNAHLLADTAMAERLAAETLGSLSSEYDKQKRELVVRGTGGTSLPLRSVASDSVRVLTFTAQIRHNEHSDDDRTSFQALGPYLVSLEELPYLGEVQAAIQSLPLSVVRVLRGKALYLSTERGKESVAIWHDVSSDRSPDHAGMQPGVFLEWRVDASNSDALVRGIARIVRETVLEGRYFGIYMHPLQFPEYQDLNAERRRLFGRRRDRLPQSPYGYVNAAAREDSTANFVEHFVAYITEPEAFRERASVEQAQGHPELMEKYRFMERLVERTPTTMERLSREHVGYIDVASQREILDEYLTRQAQKDAVVIMLRTDFGESFHEFTEAEYARFMDGLDLRRDNDLWTWSHATGIPIVGLSQRSNFFHMNAHLLEDVSAANLLSWPELTKMRSAYDNNAGRLTMVGGDGQPLQLRDLPDGIVQRTERTDGVAHNKGFSEDRIDFEALGPYLVRLADLENREELVDGIQLLPLSIVKAHRGKAIYPTNRSRTGWAVTWRVGTDTNTTFVGMQPGSFVEPRRDPKRAPASVDSLVERDLDSLRGSSTDSLLHEIGHIMDSSVIGSGKDSRSFPYQFPEFQKLQPERDRIFGEGIDSAPGTEHGYISAYSKTSVQENFADHFWAYLRDRQGFLVRAEQEQSEDHPALMEKFRFMETMVEHTPATVRRLSPQLLAESNEQDRMERERRAGRALEEYRSRWAQKESVVAAVERDLGKSFTELNRDEYARFLDDLDLSRDDDLWKWSHVTGIAIVGLTEKSNFFYANAHLLEDTQAADQMSNADVGKLQRDYDEETGQPTLAAADGRPLSVRELPEGAVRRMVRTGSFSHDEGFAEPRIVLEALAPYLLTFDAIPNRPAIVKGLRALPLSVVKAYRGKAIYLTAQLGRSYSVGMPVSNSTYDGFAGMQSGFFLDQNASPLTTHNLVHEVGHVIDYTVIKGQYGSYIHFYQFPEFRNLKPQKELNFGKDDSPVPQTDYGYVSRYSRANAQESFAEHFAYFILQNEKFREMAEEEQAAGHPELMEKYRFLEILLERTPVTTVRLSQDFLTDLEEDGEQSQLPGSKLSPGPPPWEAVHSRLSEQRDQMAADLERAHAWLLERAIAQGDRESIERLSQDPPRPRPTGYGILPEIVEDGPLSPQQLSERSYSLELLNEGFASEFREATNMANQGSGEEGELGPSVAEYERLLGRLGDLEDHLAYHANWQPAVVEYAEFFAARNQLVAEVRRMDRLRRAGETDEAARIGRDLVEKLAPFRPNAGLELVREADRMVLRVRVHTDIADGPFLAAFKEAVHSAYCESDAARSSGFALDLELIHVGPDVLYPEGAPSPGADIDVDAHLQRFPPDSLVMTTGAASTYAFTGRVVLLGSDPVTRRTLAHEFGHLLGFDDAYLRGYDGDPEGSYGVVVVEWSGLSDDLMSNSRGGQVTQEMIESMITAYGTADGMSD